MFGGANAYPKPEYLVHGEYVAFYANGAPQIRGNFEQGKLVDTLFLYYRDGTLARKECAGKNCETYWIENYHFNGELAACGQYLYSLKGRLTDYDSGLKPSLPANRWSFQYHHYILPLLYKVDPSDSTSIRVYKRITEDYRANYYNNDTALIRRFDMLNIPKEIDLRTIVKAFFKQSEWKYFSPDGLLIRRELYAPPNEERKIIEAENY